MLKKLIFTSVMILLIVTLAVSCNSEKSLAEQTDSISIRHTHYAMDPPEMTFTITDPNQVRQLITFFEELDFYDPSDEKTSPENCMGLGRDYIDFMSDGELISQYVIATGYDFIRFEPEGTWYVVTSEDRHEWNSFIEGLKNETAK